MAREQNDRRLTGQESYLKETVLTRKRYHSRSQTSEHEHCAFCWAKFMDPDFSDGHRRHIQEHPDVLTEGYTTTAEHPHGADYHWICQQCFDDFADLFRWRVVQPAD